MFRNSEIVTDSIVIVLPKFMRFSCIFVEIWKAEETEQSDPNKLSIFDQSNLFVFSTQERPNIQTVVFKNILFLFKVSIIIFLRIDKFMFRGSKFSSLCKISRQEQRTCEALSNPPTVQDQGRN